MDYVITSLDDELGELTKDDATWKFHYVIDDHSFKADMCDLHSHGLEDIFGMELQLVLALPPEESGLILNIIGLLGLKGYRFKPGDKIYGLFADKDAPVRFTLNTDSQNKPILRVWLPDENYKVDETAFDLYGRQGENPYLEKEKTQVG